MLAMETQGFVRDENGAFQVPVNRELSMFLPHDHIPTDPKTGRATAMNLRADDSFVEDAGWHLASANYAAFLKAHEGQHVLFLELGVGGNTPVMVYYFMVEILGPKNGGWDDFYGFLTRIPQWVSLLSFMPLTFAIASILRRLHNRNCIRLQRTEEKLLHSLDKQH